MTTPPRPLLSMLRAGLIAAASLVALIAPATAVAAQCAPASNTAHAIAAADSVFVGEVVETDTSMTVAQLRVESIWKGRDLLPVVEVHGAAPGSAASGSQTFVVGKTYLVVPENSRPPFLATACSATQAYTAPPNLIPTAYQDATGSSLGRSAAAPDTSSEAETELLQSILPMLGLIALIGMTWAVISHFRGLEPERAASFAPQPEPTPPAEVKVKTRSRSMQRDTSGASRTRARTLKKNTRGFKRYRRKQERQVASSRKASGSTDTS